MLGGRSSSNDESIIEGMVKTLARLREETGSKYVQKAKIRRVSANFSDELE